MSSRSSHSRDALDMDGAFDELADFDEESKRTVGLLLQVWNKNVGAQLGGFASVDFSAIGTHLKAIQDALKGLHSVLQKEPLSAPLVVKLEEDHGSEIATTEEKVQACQRLTVALV